MIFRTILNGIKGPWKIIAHPKLRKLFNWIPSKLYLKCMFRTLIGKSLDFDNPRDFNEKLQWLKLYERKPEYTEMADKCTAKVIVAEKIGKQHIIKTLGVWETFDSIDFSSLPDRFVLKCTHDSAGLVICRDKTKFDFETAKKKLTKCLKRNFYYAGREWPYKNIKPQIIAEEYMEDSVFHELRDYKFFTFGGKSKVVHIVSNRSKENEPTYGDFYDMDFVHLDLTMGHDNAPIEPAKPKCFEDMKKYAEILAEGTKHLRVDFYEVDGKLYFGELTFFQDSGFANIQPPRWNRILGDWIEIT